MARLRDPGTRQAFVSWKMFRLGSIAAISFRDRAFSASCSRVRSHQNGHAAGWRPRKIIATSAANTAMALAESLHILHVADHAATSGLLVVSNPLKIASPVSGKFAYGAPIQQHGGGKAL